MNHIPNRIMSRLNFLWAYYIKSRANPVIYLRSLGVKIGNNCDILTSPHNFGTEPWLIELGNNVTIGQGVLLITHDGTSRLFRDWQPGSCPYGNKFGTIAIRDNCFIGSNAILLAGIQIGPDSAVGAGSVVTKTVPPRVIAAGNPARVIKTLDEYLKSYHQRMTTIQAVNRDELRSELTKKFWGCER